MIKTYTSFLAFILFKLPINHAHSIVELELQLNSVFD